MSTNPTHITAPVGTPFIEVVREFDAAIGLVFLASTDPGLVAQWLGPRELTMRVDDVGRDRARECRVARRP